MFLIFVVLCSIAILYIVEVRLGSSHRVYNCELGQAPEMSRRTRISPKEFFSQMLPLLLLALGLPLLFLLPLWGWGLLALAGVSFLGSRPWTLLRHP